MDRLWDGVEHWATYPTGHGVPLPLSTSRLQLLCQCFSKQRKDRPNNSASQQLIGKTLTTGNVTRFEKNTHISLISNSVTHLQSYINTAIADIAGNSALAPMSPYRAPISQHQALMLPHQSPMLLHRDATTSVRVFHDVSQCFKFKGTVWQ